MATDHIPHLEPLCCFNALNKKHVAKGIDWYLKIWKTSSYNDFKSVKNNLSNCLRSVDYAQIWETFYDENVGKTGNALNGYVIFSAT